MDSDPVPYHGAWPKFRELFAEFHPRKVNLAGIALEGMASYGWEGCVGLTYHQLPSGIEKAFIPEATWYLGSSLKLPEGLLSQIEVPASETRSTLSKEINDYEFLMPLGRETTVIEPSARVDLLCQPSRLMAFPNIRELILKFIEDSDHPIIIVDNIGHQHNYTAGLARATRPVFLFGYRVNSLFPSGNGLG